MNSSDYWAIADRAEVLQKSRDDWTYYLKTIRPLLGWTIFVGRSAD